MNNNRFQRWLQNIYNTRDEEISCTECFDMVSGFVDLELSGQDASLKLPLVTQHLGQCAACREEYETLHELALLEKEGKLPSSDDLQDLIH
ncbi:MAG TPA: hypothetical protein VGK00_11420 [Anaerolineales bacterium]